MEVLKMPATEQKRQLWLEATMGFIIQPGEFDFAQGRASRSHLGQASTVRRDMFQTSGPKSPPKKRQFGPGQPLAILQLLDLHWSLLALDRLQHLEATHQGL